MLLLSVGSLLPFFHSMMSIIRIIPCPRMAAMVSNAALVGVFVGLLLVGWLLYGNVWVTYVYLMSIWPWLAVGTVLARLHIGRDREVTHFSPLVHYPILAVLGCGSTIGMLLALKDMTIIDCVVLSFMDPVLSAVFHALLIHRTFYFEKYLRELLLITTLVFLYIYGQSYTGGVVRAYLDSVTFISNQGVLSTGTYILFLGSRAAGLLRCCYIKKSFLPVVPPNNKRDFKSLFPSFPFPIRFRLDVLFDSGLVEDVPHAVGPTGTIDLYTLTENLYMLPLSSLMSWLIEQIADNTLESGLTGNDSVAGAPSTGIVWVVLGIFILSVALTPIATSKILFDRGSSTHSWSLVPQLILLLYIALDLLYLNPTISRFQLVCLVLLFSVVLNYRTDLWLDFKRRYLETSMKELEYLQPSCMRVVQKATLRECLEKTGVEDFGTMLLETSIHHGNNIQVYLQKNEKARIWDPKPSATAAWKLAGSLVIRAIRTRKAKLNLDQKIKRTTHDYMVNIVDSMIASAATRERRPTRI